MDINSIGTRVRNGLFRLDNQPLGFQTIIVLVFLDFFVFGSLLNGLDEHTRQLTSPTEYIPHYCRDAYINRTWTESNNLKQLGNLVNRYNEGARYPSAQPEQHPTCESLTGKLRAITADAGAGNELKRWTTTLTEIEQTNQTLALSSTAYQTNLLEDIAEVEKVQGGSAVRQSVTAATERLEMLTERATTLEASLRSNAKIAALLSELAAYTDADRQTLIAALRDANFWYPVKKLAMEAIFLAPLIIGFYVWHAWSMKNSRPFQALLSAHLLVVAAIPAVLKLAELLYDIIPRRLLEDVLQLLESLGLVAIWHYLVIAISIAAAGAAIYLFQNKLFSREREMTKRISKGQCQRCGVKLQPDEATCAHCGFAQLHDCSSCGGLTYVYGAYCRHCGASQT